MTHLDVEPIEAQLHLSGFHRRAGSPPSSPLFALPAPDQRHQHRSVAEFADLCLARKFSEIAAGARDRCRPAASSATPTTTRLPTPPRPVSRQSHQGGGPLNHCCQPPTLPLVERSRRRRSVESPLECDRRTDDDEPLFERSFPCSTVSSASRGSALM